MQIDDKKVVTLTYTLSVLHPDGVMEFVEKRGEDDPVEFVFGKALLLPKVEQALKGTSQGFEIQMKIKPEDAFGLRDEGLVLSYPKERLPKEVPLKVGMKFQTQGPKGDAISVILKEIKDTEVILDGNHPLADEFIQFDLKILKVREATEDELRSGEVIAKLLH
jgi:FKBP-type peptidyl-prolyl cis-trans isomerase SlyD